MRLSLILAASIFFATALHAEDPDLKGCITHVASPSEFDVNGVHLRLSRETQFFKHEGGSYFQLSAAEISPYLGQRAEIFGRWRDKQHAIAARRVNLQAPEPREVSGLAIVDAIVADSATPASAASARPLMRADGYLIRIAPAASIDLDPSLTADSAYRTNLWIAYHGTLGADGIVVADKLSLSPNAVAESEEKLRARTEHDPAAVDPAAKQSAASKAFRGLDPKQIPPYRDDAMQQRIQRIGEKLIPAYQRQLAASDPTRINFRFQLVDQPKWPDAYSWPNGIILVPYQIVARLSDDSQLAAVLADNIAAILEKQVYQSLPARRRMCAAQIVGSVGGMFVPGLSLGTWATNSVVAKKIEQHAVEQSGRVSLQLMRDAGYDPLQAPLAWWTIADSKSRGLEQTSLPLAPNTSTGFSVSPRKD